MYILPYSYILVFFALSRCTIPITYSSVGFLVQSNLWMEFWTSLSIFILFFIHNNVGTQIVSYSTIFRFLTPSPITLGAHIKEIWIFSFLLRWLGLKSLFWDCWKQEVCGTPVPLCWPPLSSLRRPEVLPTAFYASLDIVGCHSSAGVDSSNTLSSLQNSELLLSSRSSTNYPPNWQAGFTFIYIVNIYHESF